MGRLLAKFFTPNQVRETPSGTVDGSNTTFTLSGTPITAASLILVMNGLVQDQTTDYTLSGSTITMTTAPILGQSLTAFYFSK